jgi:hypothetical protein
MRVKTPSARTLGACAAPVSGANPQRETRPASTEPLGVPLLVPELPVPEELPAFELPLAFRVPLALRLPLAFRVPLALRLPLAPLPGGKLPLVAPVCPEPPSAVARTVATCPPHPPRPPRAKAHGSRTTREIDGLMGTFMALRALLGQSWLTLFPSTGEKTIPTGRTIFREPLLAAEDSCTSR